jgi:hypothetical protein
VITSRQIREARALLGLTRSALATKVRMIAIATVTRAELVDGEPPITSAQAVVIRSFFEAAGIEFADENSGELGMRLRKSAR